jgi:hypothetical protein
MARSHGFLKAGDFALLRLAPYLRVLGEIEDEFLAGRFADMPIEKPVFVTGLARSGTTMMLTLLSHANSVATHRYRDFPFLFAPVAWNRFQDLMGSASDEAVERPHKDRIRITKDSPEAFEEPLWQAHFPWAHDPAQYHVIGKETSNEGFEAAFALHLKKILWLRGGKRYVSKGNYNVTRIAYLARMFPDARFVVPVREPVSHVHSLVKQHELFTQYAAQDARVPRYLEAAGHYEFGPQRRPINLDRARIGEIDAAWRMGDDYRGYARQWAQVYGHVDRLRRDPWLSTRIMVVRYEDACAAPQVLRRDLLKALSLSDPLGRVNAAAATLSAPQQENVPAAAEKTVWEEAGAVAAAFGYRPPGVAKAA